MKIYFVRHGETEHNKKGVTTGHIDSPLTSEGKEEALKTSLEIPMDFSEIYSGDLARYKQTAEILNEQLNIPIIYDSRLRERHFGSLENKSWEEIGPELRELDKNQKYNYHPYGGESVEDVQNRLFSFINELREKKGKFLVVTSGGIIRLLHNLLKGETHEVIHNSSVHEFDF